MKPVLIENAHVIRPPRGAQKGSVLIDEGRIVAIDPSPNSIPEGVDRVDAAGRRLTPGMLDVHTHGIGPWRYEAARDLPAASEFLARFGTTCVFPTFVPVPGPNLESTLASLTAKLDSLEGARMPGFHLEGPFMKLPGAACPTIPGDVPLLEDIVAACDGRVTIMSVSPDTENIIPVIERLVEKGIVPFVTHTAANVEETQRAIDAGARHATHFFDVFPFPEETDPGVRPVGCVEVFLADRRASVDFIADGCHVHPIAIKMALAAKGCRGVMLITDSNIGAGLPPGEYDTPWGYKVRVKEGDGARIAGDHPNAGSLAGSALTMDVGMGNLLSWLDLPEHETWAMGTSSVADLVQMPSYGRIEEGAEADLVLWDENLRAARTWVGGQCVFDATET